MHEHHPRDQREHGEHHGHHHHQPGSCRTHPSHIVVCDDPPVIEQHNPYSQLDPAKSVGSGEFRTPEGVEHRPGASYGPGTVIVQQPGTPSGVGGIHPGKCWSPTTSRTDSVRTRCSEHWDPWSHTGCPMASWMFHLVPIISAYLSSRIRNHLSLPQKPPSHNEGFLKNLRVLQEWLILLFQGRDSPQIETNSNAPAIPWRPHQRCRQVQMPKICMFTGYFLQTASNCPETSYLLL